MKKCFQIVDRLPTMLKIKKKKAIAFWSVRKMSDDEQDYRDE